MKTKLVHESDLLLNNLRFLKRIQGYDPNRLHRVTRRAYLRHCRRFYSVYLTVPSYPVDAGRPSARSQLTGALGQGGNNLISSTATFAEKQPKNSSAVDERGAQATKEDARRISKSPHTITSGLLYHSGTNQQENAVSLFTDAQIKPEVNTLDPWATVVQNGLNP